MILNNLLHQQVSDLLNDKNFYKLRKNSLDTLRQSFAEVAERICLEQHQQLISNMQEIKALESFVLPILVVSGLYNSGKTTFTANMLSDASFQLLNITDSSHKKTLKPVIWFPQKFENKAQELINSLSNALSVRVEQLGNVPADAAKQYQLASNESDLSIIIGFDAKLEEDQRIVIDLPEIISYLANDQQFNDLLKNIFNLASHHFIVASFDQLLTSDFNEYLNLIASFSNNLNCSFVSNKIMGNVFTESVDNIINLTQHHDFNGCYFMIFQSRHSHHLSVKAPVLNKKSELIEFIGNDINPSLRLYQSLLPAKAKNTLLIIFNILNEIDSHDSNNVENLRRLDSLIDSYLDRFFNFNGKKRALITPGMVKNLNDSVHSKTPFLLKLKRFFSGEDDIYHLKNFFKNDFFNLFNDFIKKESSYLNLLNHVEYSRLNAGVDTYISKYASYNFYDFKQFSIHFWEDAYTYNISEQPLIYKNIHIVLSSGLSEISRESFSPSNLVDALNTLGYSSYSLPAVIKDRADLITEIFMKQQAGDFRDVLYQVLGLPIYNKRSNFLTVYFLDMPHEFKSNRHYGQVNNNELLDNVETIFKKILSLQSIEKNSD